MRIKVLFIIPTLDRSGAEKQLSLLAAKLPKEKFDVKVALLTRSGPYETYLNNNRVSVELIGKKHKFSPIAYFRLKRLIKAFKPDIVHTWLFAANAYGRKAAIACKTPIIICGERCLDPWKSKWQYWVDSKLEPKTDVYAVNSSGIVDFYVDKGIPRKKFIVIPNAVEAPQLPTADKDSLKKQLLNDLHLPLNVNTSFSSAKNEVFNKMNISGACSNQTERIPFIIGVVARLWPQKRIRDALWAADQLKFAQLNFYLLIIGDGPEREALLRYREDLQIRDRVIFLGERSDVSNIMPCLDLLWNCSAYEGQSNSILEAQSFGVPVIASDVPGNRDLVITGKNGLLISEFNGDETRRRTAFSRETIRLLKPENDILRRNLGTFARKRVQLEFSIEKAIQRHIDLYEGLIASKNVQ